MKLWKILTTPLGELFGFSDSKPPKPYERPRSLQVGTGGSLGGGGPRPFDLPLPDEPRTVAERLDVACAEHGCDWTRRREPDGTVKMTADYPDGERLVATGATTRRAVFSLIERMEAHE